MLYQSIHFYLQNNKKYIKFIIVGASSFVINLAAIWLFIHILDRVHLVDKLAEILPIEQKDKLGADIANIIAIEISILFNFFYSRRWTWNHIEKHHGRMLAYQCFKFHIAILPGFIIRALLFPILSHVFKIHYIVNTMIGVAISMVLNFLLYDKIVFTGKKRKKS